MTKKQLVEIIKRVVREESNNSITINVGGTRYNILRNGSIKRLGSEQMDFGSDSKLVGAVSNYGWGNRRFSKDDMEISLNDIFSNPNVLVGKFPIVSINGKLGMNLGGVKESDNKVLWVK